MAHPDMDADYWTMADIADYLEVKLRTVHTYRQRRKDGDPNGLPPEDKMIGRTPVWKPATITSWPRPGRGAGGGRPRKDDEF
ncbi:hypothetical protein [Nonomuraea africana]|uniref:DNA-binding protein n=1 Tax=Nonomuraea africana TaxID=46171 RepID=A0ABR9K6I6_9ACTN|nr:hypothetical protein [Nonomuraea africana]MBE1557632.1 hypothetical protein [Nonomuraea africana]